MFRSVFVHILIAAYVMVSIIVIALFSPDENQTIIKAKTTDTQPHCSVCFQVMRQVKACINALLSCSEQADVVRKLIYK